MGLREDVIVKTLTGELHGHLFIGTDGLPEVDMNERRMDYLYPDRYRLATFPDAWEIDPVQGRMPGHLLQAWWNIQQIQHDLAVAERETEDDAKEHERNRSIDNAIALEVDH